MEQSHRVRSLKHLVFCKDKNGEKEKKLKKKEKLLSCGPALRPAVENMIRFRPGVHVRALLFLCLAA